MKQKKTPIQMSSLHGPQCREYSVDTAAQVNAIHNANNPIYITRIE